MMYPVSVIHTIDNKSFIVDGVRWTPCPVGTSLADAQKMHRSMFPFDYMRPKFVAPKFHTVTMKSLSRKNAGKSVYYEVRVYDNGQVECNCPGYHFRHRCRHVEYVVSTMKKLKRRLP